MAKGNKEERACLHKRANSWHAAFKRGTVHDEQTGFLENEPEQMDTSEREVYGLRGHTSSNNRWQGLGR